MKKTLLVLSFCMFFNAAQASTVFDVPGIDNLQWLELTTSQGMTRLQVEGELGTGGLFDGWRYATRLETETLYDSLWGGTTEGQSADNYAGARIFFDAFGHSDYYLPDNNSGYSATGWSQWQPYFGSSTDCSAPNFSCGGNIIIQDTSFNGTENTGYFDDLNGLSTGVDSINDQRILSKTSGGLQTASHLVREVSIVPVPAAMWLFGSGLIGLIGLSQRRG